MFASRILLALSLLAGMLCASCIGGPAPAESPLAPLAAIPALSELARDAADADEFLLQQPGADFAVDLPSSNCAADNTSAQLDPFWSLQQNALSNAAYCFYRLSYDPLALPVQLTLECSDLPVDGTCWIGLSNWLTSRWDWQPLPASGVLDLPNPSPYLDAQQRCYVAVLLLSNQSCTLDKIGFGEPPPDPVGDGATLIAPVEDTKTYLIDMDGNIVHEWESAYKAGVAAKLGENGHLWRKSFMGNPIFDGGGTGGRIEEFDWNGNLVWEYELSTGFKCTHHDFELLPNGNVLLIVWNLIPDALVIDAGRNPDKILPASFWADSIIEVEPTRPVGGNIVWEWKALDHLVQDFDTDKDNFGAPGEHPELIDINFPPVLAGDWTHLNGIYYDAELEQLLVTSRQFCEVWVIDKSTTAAEVAGHTGGRYGRGGDLLYRWGNPASYRAGTANDKVLFGCHDGHWIGPGLDGSGDILVFNNLPNEENPEELPYSSVIQFTPPLNPDGSYFMTDSKWGPDAPNWEYIADPPHSLFSAFMSGAQRLPGGETLICSAGAGRLIVVDDNDEVKWEYQNPYPEAASSQGLFRALRYLPDYPGLAELE